VYERLKSESSDYVDKLISRLEDYMANKISGDKKNLIIKSGGNNLTRLWNINKKLFTSTSNSSFRIAFKDNAVSIKDKIDIKESITISLTNQMHIYSYIELFEEGNYNILNNLDQLILADNIEDIVIAFEDKMKLSIDFLENINNFFGTDKDINYLIVEVILNMILRLNNNRFRLTYYSMLLIKLIYNNDLKSLLQDALDNKIISSISNMDIESIDNFITFLSLYISNNEFNFDYNKLKLIQLMDGPKPLYFIKCLIDCVTYLGTKDRAKELLDKSLQQYIPDDDTAKKK
jgi:hypothetical protein